MKTQKTVTIKATNREDYHNLSQEQLADMAGVHRTYIGMVERAEKNITLRNIKKIAKALDVNIKDLF